MYSCVDLCFLFPIGTHDWFYASTILFLLLLIKKVFLRSGIVIPPALFFFAQDYFGNLGVFVVPYEC